MQSGGWVVLHVQRSKLSLKIDHRHRCYQPHLGVRGSSYDRLVINYALDFEYLEFHLV